MKSFILLAFVLCFFFGFSQKKYENGPYVEHYSNGELKREGFYKHDKRVGIWKDYYDTGQLKKNYSYNHEGQLTGIEESYSKSGTLISETKKMSNSVLLAKRYYDVDKLKIVYTLIPKTNGKGFIKSGFYKEFYPNDTLKIESNYYNGELTGLWKQYGLTGKKEWEVEYLNGYKQGKYSSFYKNGKLKLQGSHDLDLKSGEEKIYDSIGNEIQTLKYKKGILKNASNLLNGINNIVPDGVIEHVPIYPGCKKELGNFGKKKCMSDQITAFVSEKFNTSFAKKLGLTGKEKINVIFKISKQGRVIDIKARANHKALETEAIRVTALLPKLTPGKQHGKPVVVPYSLPIIFQIK